MGSNFMFTPRERGRLLEIMRRCIPGKVLEDTPESVGLVIDLIRDDVVVLADPLDGVQTSFYPSKQWDPAKQGEVMTLLRERLEEAPDAE